MDAALRFLTGSLAGTVVPLRTGPVRLGRGPDVEVVFSDEDARYVSRHHATILREGDAIVLADEGSTNGTYVNGRRVERVALELGDEVRLGGGGPKAVLIDAVAGATRSVSDRREARAQDGFTVQVRRAVQDALAAAPRPSSNRWTLALIGVVAVSGLAFSGLNAFGFVGERAREQRLDRWQEEYVDRVVLVEVGAKVGDEYIRLGWGTGFVADTGGFIITNKHVIHGHKYSASTACVAESFRRNGLSYEDALVFTVWKGGTRFRQDADSEEGDRQLGFSTEYGSLELVTVATDNFAEPTTESCTDPFTSRRFQHRWRRHVQDNNDLALLRATGAWEPVPLANSDPEAGDPVMVFGFPSALTPLETEDAEPIARKGEVLRTQETVLIDAVVLGGNSGGPLIGSDGTVIGVATRGISGLLNMGIKVEHVHQLLDHAKRAETP